MTYCMSEVVNKLKAEGLDNAREHRIRHGIKAGYIPRPQRDASGRYRFATKDVTAIRKYLKNVPAPGRKATLPIQFAKTGKPVNLSK